MVASENVVLKWDEETQPIAKPRASALYGSCIRLHVLGTRLNKSQKRYTSFGMKLVFGFGNAIHYWAQNDPALLGDRRRGFWRCRACKAISRFGPPPRYKCGNCGARPEAFEYAEFSFNLKGDLSLTGHIDMFLEKGQGIFRVLELKTINGDDFDKLVAPLIEHSWQVHAYVLGCQESKSMPVKIDDEVGYILYVSKKNKRKVFPVKMFVVKIENPLMDRLKEKVAGYRIGLTDYPKNLPDPHDECVRANFENYRARTCPCLKECRDFLLERQL